MWSEEVKTGKRLQRVYDLLSAVVAPLESLLLRAFLGKPWERTM
jgi:hypothetical protein